MTMLSSTASQACGGDASCCMMLTALVRLVAFLLAYEQLYAVCWRQAATLPPLAAQLVGGGGLLGLTCRRSHQARGG